jgi:hypothetical protein
VKELVEIYNVPISVLDLDLITTFHAVLEVVNNGVWIVTETDVADADNAVMLEVGPNDSLHVPLVLSVGSIAIENG